MTQEVRGSDPIIFQYHEKSKLSDSLSYEMMFFYITILVIKDTLSIPVKHGRIPLRETEAIKLPSLAENFSLRIQTRFCSFFFSHTP